MLLIGFGLLGMGCLAMDLILDLLFDDYGKKAVIKKEESK